MTKGKTIVDKELLRVMRKYYSALDSLKQFNSSMGNSTKLATILVLALKEKYVEGNFNKTYIHEALKGVGVNISYKNTTWVLEQLRKEGLVSFRRVKKDYNSTYITVNKEKVRQQLNKLNKSIKEIMSAIL